MISNNILRPISHIILIVWLLLSMGFAASETIPSAEYFPLSDGNSWTYLVSNPSGTYSETMSVLPGTTIINGVATKKLWDSDGSFNYWTSDTSGIKLHAMYFPEPPAALVTFNPPMVFSSGTMNIPQTVDSSGLALYEFDDGSSLWVNYIASSTAEARESLTVPAGSYDTVRLNMSLRMYLVGVIDVSETRITWVARHLGEVQSEETFEGVTETRELTETNIILPVTPMPWIPLLLLD